MQYRLSLTSLTEYPPLSISFRGSNGYQLPIDITSNISSEAKEILALLLAEQISPSIQSEVVRLLQLERDCVQQRKQLIENYRKKFNDDIQPILADLPSTHPELFI